MYALHGLQAAHKWLNAFKQLPGNRLVSGCHVRGNEALAEQKGHRIHSKPLRRQGGAMLKGTHRACRMQPPQGAPNDLQRALSLDVRLPARLSGEHGKAEALVDKKRASIPPQRGDAGQFKFSQLLREGVLLQNCFAAPSPRAVELGNHRLAAFDAHLEDPVFVAVQWRQSAIRVKPGTVQRIEREIRGQPGIGGSLILVGKHGKAL